MRLSDIADLGSEAPGEELRPARLEDASAMLPLLEGVDAVLHLGGVSTEQPWDPILQANIVGATTSMRPFASKASSAWCLPAPTM